MRLQCSQVILLLVLLSGVMCDLPVHCLKSQIVGPWKLSLSDPQQDGGMACGHEIPDSAKTSYQAGQSEFVEASTLILDLSADNSVSQSGSANRGRWTMVYDEGFEINFSQTKYLAFSSYVPKGRRDFDSHCGQTLIGWYNNIETGSRGCYRASRVGDTTEATASLDQVSVVQPEFLQLPGKALSNDFTQHDEVVSTLNQNFKKSWNAKLHPQFEGKSMLELNGVAGRRKYHQPGVFAQVTNKQHSSDVSDLPESLSWEEYLAPPRQQQRCGSCYAIATMAMLSARLRMQGEDVTLSPQHSVDCNYYNQGCDGGYPFLVEKFFSENNLVTEKEYPYTAETGECKKVDSNSQYKVKNYAYVGGAYGQSNERAMMLEMQNNGPVVVNFEPGYDFMTYGGGVYHSVKDADWSSNGYAPPEWVEKVDHSVLCYGWGEDQGEKYWLLQNSWGEQWGEKGNFRMKRGVDESACESMSEAAEPAILNNQSATMFVQQTQHLRQSVN